MYELKGLLMVTQKYLSESCEEAMTRALSEDVSELEKCRLQSEYAQCCVYLSRVSDMLKEGVVGITREEYASKVLGHHKTLKSAGAVRYIQNKEG